MDLHSLMAMLVLLVPSEDVCRANMETAVAFAKTEHATRESDLRWYQWYHLKQGYDYPDQRKYATLLALEYAAKCEVSDRRIGVWPVPIPVTIERR
jgi:hypothetical protein